MQISGLDGVSVKGKRVLVRADLNVPLQDGKVSDLYRLQSSLPTLEYLINQGAKIILISHLGRPDGMRQKKYSLQPVASALERLLKKAIQFSSEIIGKSVEEKANNLKEGDILLLENLRFCPEEEENDLMFAQSLAHLGDLYVNDAFASSHRSHASIEAITKYLPSYAGKLMEMELRTLEHLLEKPQRPFMAIVGGAKISSKLEILEHMLTRVDILAIVGGMANTFLFAKGYEVGTSLCEETMVSEVERILKKAQEEGKEIILPIDVVVAAHPQEGVPIKVVEVSEIPSTMMVLDAGPYTTKNIMDAIDKSRTLVWNGSLGIHELKPFDEATNFIAKHIAQRTQQGKLISIAGGGDTVAALNQSNTTEEFSYVSTAGGAFLEWLEGKELPGVEALRKASS
jgi:phosphoglycerate kinase